MNLSKLFNDFFHSEKSAGVILIACTVFSLALANSGFGAQYVSFWHITLPGGTITHWINDGLMTIFFLMIGLELEREIYGGELSSFKNAVLPIVAAAGGMIVPALIYLFFNYGTSTQSGAGIPMATDIAFSLGILSIIGKKIPPALKLFLTALAVIDDLGAIIIIALFYSGGLSWIYLLLVLLVFGTLLILNRLKVHAMYPYIIGGIALWYFMSKAGVHPSISGVLLAFAIPYGDGKENTASYRLQSLLHSPVAYIILPLFALANTCIPINNNFSDLAIAPNGLGILTGLVIGKPLGIFIFSWLAVSFGICKLQSSLNWKHIFGIGLLGGIGFTMSIFISQLAFSDHTIIDGSKLIVLVASFFAAIIGYVWLKVLVR